MTKNLLAALGAAILSLCLGVADAQQITPRAPSGALTLTTGGTAQQLFAAGEVQYGCIIQNPTTATEPIWYDTTGASAVMSAGSTSIQLPAGSAVGCEGNITKSISWVAATTGHAISAKKW